MPEFNLPQDPVHLGLLRKFQKLKNQVLRGREAIKGSDNSGLPADDLVPAQHRLHDLIRGFYKPRGWDCMLSYLATERGENYGEQIVWSDRERGEFEKIIMKPPGKPGDRRAISDIEAARAAMRRKIPIGIIENVGRGINRCLGLGLISEETESGEFIVRPVDLPEELTAAEAPAGRRNYFSVRTREGEIVEAVLRGEPEVVIGGLRQLESEMRAGDVVFLAFGGDRPPWDPGLRAVCTIKQPPYDQGYDQNNPRYFRIKVAVELVLPRALTREDLVPYRNCFNIMLIGPMTKWEPNQANQLIPEEKAVTLVRAILDYFPELEDELRRVFGEEFMNRAKDATEILVPMMVRYGEGPAAGAGEEAAAEQWEPEVENIIGPLKMNRETVLSMQALINIGKHIILAGPPGTGKTTLAENACREAVRLNYISDYIMSTATSDWTTFDTVGGYMLEGGGSTRFAEGIVLQSIRRNAWLVIGEINRADADKAFGEVLTILSRKPAVLPYKDERGRPYRIDFTDARTSYFDSAEAVYWIGRNWRVLATMNTYDKNALFALSHAFMRRFAFVEVPIPEEGLLNELIDETASDSSVRNFLRHIVKVSPVPLGPALLRDLAEYLERRGMDGAVSGLVALILPQLEGLSEARIASFCREAAALLGGDQRESLKKAVSSMFGISLKRLASWSHAAADSADGGEGEEEGFENE
ncbi:AAA family ATPase [Desulfovirgula thermocuniculi]|uniref:AAA family ATPase n=1 Tax=Desulfovirgula thermocuniculi TaxID=348842 RepID=UPI00040D239F|nr:AAA family ATPase [Desulfovirgula thermocuniculi]